jgi:hypothetical protein
MIPIPHTPPITRFHAGSLTVMELIYTDLEEAAMSRPL